MTSAKNRILCLSAAVTGGAAFVVRQLLYKMGMDEKELLIPWHPLTVVLGILSAVTVILVLGLSLKQEKKICAAPTGAIAAIGSIFLSLVLLYAVILRGAFSGALWILGILAGLALLAAAVFQWKGKQPSFLTNGFLCMFLAFYLVNRYQVWSCDPQVLDYGMLILGSVAMMVYAYQMAAGNLSQCSRRTFLAMGGLGVYFCLMMASGEVSGLVCLGGAVWMLAGLWSGTTEGVERT